MPLQWKVGLVVGEGKDGGNEGSWATGKGFVDAGGRASSEASLEGAYPSQLWPKSSSGTGSESHESANGPRVPVNPLLWLGDISPAFLRVFAISDRVSPKGPRGPLIPTRIPTVHQSFKRDAGGQRIT